jgi:hypothetical protein
MFQIYSFIRVQCSFKTVAAAGQHSLQYCTSVLLKLRVYCNYRYKYIYKNVKIMILALILYRSMHQRDKCSLYNLF